MLPILVESIEVAGRIKGCTFSLMLFSATPSPLAWQLLYTAAKEGDTMSAASRAGLLQCRFSRPSDKADRDLATYTRQEYRSCRVYQGVTL